MADKLIFNEEAGKTDSKDALTEGKPTDVGVEHEKERETFMGYDIVTYERRIVVEPDLPIQDVWAKPSGFEEGWYVNDGLGDTSVPNLKEAMVRIRKAILHYADGKPPEKKLPAESVNK